MSEHDPLSMIRDIHRDIDREANELAAAHAGRLQCGLGCSGCCDDDLTVWRAEAERILEEFGELLAEAQPHPVGRCAMLDEQTGACRIYSARPYVCRTQGLPLRFVDEHPETGEWVEFRDICPLNDAAEHAPLEELAACACWEIGPVEQRLGHAELRRSGGMERMERVRLRDLFET
ncbi:MAG: YkgJ family cysteine cluster protein [Myxococcota bacterium]